MEGVSGRKLSSSVLSNIEQANDLLKAVYHLISPPCVQEQKVYEGAHRVVDIKVLSPHTGYCVVAEMYQPMLDRKSQRSRERCVESP